MNRIPQDQNAEKQLRRLLGQRQLYSRAKDVLAVQMLLSVPFSVGWAALALWFPQTKVYAAAWGAIVALLDPVLFTPWQKNLKSRAAKIQEAFDCDVLGLEWRSIKASGHPDPEDLPPLQLSGQAEEDDERLRNWYPPAVGVLPLPLARLVCQRANCWWDAQLRRRYAKCVQGAVAAIFLTVFLIGLVGKFKIDQWLLTGVFPLLPVFILGIRQSIEQNEAADRLDALRRHAERIWAEMVGGLSEESATRQSRELQDELFDHRRRNPLIFDWVYRLLRNEQEEKMNRAAVDLIEEARIYLNLHPDYDREQL